MQCNDCNVMNVMYWLGATMSEEKQQQMQCNTCNAIQWMQCNSMNAMQFNECN